MEPLTKKNNPDKQKNNAEKVCKQHLSDKENYQDNTVTKRFFGSLKKQPVNNERFPTREQARAVIRQKPSQSGKSSGDLKCNMSTSSLQNAFTKGDPQTLERHYLEQLALDQTSHQGLKPGLKRSRSFLQTAAAAQTFVLDPTESASNQCPDEPKQEPANE